MQVEASTLELLTPVAGAPADCTATEFRWHATSDTAYRLQVAADEMFERIMIDAEVGKTDSVTLFNVFQPNHNTLYWRVGNNKGSTWSSGESFETVTDVEASRARAELVSHAATLASESTAVPNADPASNAAVPMYMYQTTSKSSLTVGLTIILVTIATVSAILFSTM